MNALDDLGVDTGHAGEIAAVLKAIADNPNLRLDALKNYL